MERNKWETAIRCLEVALHPNTADDEVIAGVNGFRRTAQGTPLSDIAREYGAGAEAEPAPAATDVQRLARENFALRRRMDEQLAGQEEALRRLDEARRLIEGLAQEIDAEKQNFAEFRAASAQIVDGLRGENVDLRGALETARIATARPTAPSFRDRLAAALGEAPANAPPEPPRLPRHPWTA